MVTKNGPVTYRHKEGKTIVQHNRQSPLLIELQSPKKTASKGQYRKKAEIIGTVF